MRYFFEIAFNGTHYHGWQIQDNAISIQQVIQEKLVLLTKQKNVHITGCGRTDTGVHASQFYFHVDLKEINDLNRFTFLLNNVLPLDIEIKQILVVSNESHSRFDALSRTYEYRISTTKAPFDQGLVTYVAGDLNIENMSKCCSALLGKHEFTSFSKVHTDVNHFFCEVYEAFWSKKNEQIIFTIKANLFLRNMVRAIVGTMLLVGKEKISVNEFKKIMDLKDRTKAGPSAKAKGLFLTNVNYPSQIYV